MDSQQWLKLTHTNRSCGLTTYFPIVDAIKRGDGRRRSGYPPADSRRAGRRYKSSHRNVVTQSIDPINSLLIVHGHPSSTRSVVVHPNHSCQSVRAGHQASHASHFECFFLAAIPERSHPFPSRTRKLSSSGPMVLQGQPCGRVGRCRGFEGSLARVGLLSFSAPVRHEATVHHVVGVVASAQPRDERTMCRVCRIGPAVLRARCYAHAHRCCIGDPRDERTMCRVCRATSAPCAGGAASATHRVTSAPCAGIAASATRGAPTICWVFRIGDRRYECTMCWLCAARPAATIERTICERSRGRRASAA